jgi:HK97 family phage major capsid protein
MFAHAHKASPETMLEKVYGRDAEVVEVVRSLVNPANTGVAGWAAELVREDVRGFLDLLKAQSVYPRLAAAGTTLDFAGAHSIKIPGRNPAGGRVAGSFTGEAGLIPVKKIGFQSTTLNAYKMAVISTFSREIVEQSTPNIETLVRDAMVTDTGEAIDAALLSANAAVAGISPAGIQVGATSAASAGATLANILTDVRAMTDALAAGRGGRNPVWIMNPSRIQGLSFLQTAAGAFLYADELRGGRFMGIPVIASVNVPSAVVYLIDAAEFVSAFDAPMFMVSDQATIVEIDDDGTDPTITGGGLTAISNVTEAVTATPPGKVRSLYQTDSLALRMIMPLSWAMLRPSLVQIRTGVAW